MTGKSPEETFHPGSDVVIILPKYGGLAKHSEEDEKLNTTCVGKSKLTTVTKM